ncbi:MAG: DUF4476 domain-containing protein [Lentimicrobiaceae bacterium]|nr:DUF4476 domain-containing protein [Lentimicrobiaceae bacterium]
MRKKLPLLLLLAALLQLSSFAQLKSNLVFFTEQGERFTVILNGIRQNPTPETNVKVTDLIAPNYKLKVIFDDPALGEIDKNLMFNQGYETTFSVKRNNKNEYVVRWMNEVPIAQALPPAPGQQVVVYTTQAAPAAPVTYTQTTTTVTDTYAEPQEGNVSMGININDPELGVNFNMNVNGGSINTGSQVTTTQTTTSYSTTTTTGGYQQAPPTQQMPQTYVMPGYNGPVGCPYPMHPGDFQSVKQSIASKSFDDTRLTIAKQVISSNCLLSDQVKEIMLLFTFEDTRLELAKYAYGYTYDIGNYYRLNDAFTFESSIEELNDYMNGYRR